MLKKILYYIALPFAVVYQWLMIKDDISGLKVKNKRYANDVFDNEENRKRFLNLLSKESKKQERLKIVKPKHKGKIRRIA